MKRVGLRLASALVAISICFGASARAHVAIPSAPLNQHSSTLSVSPDLLPTSVIVLVTITAALTTRLTKGAVTHSLEQVDPAAQFDVTR